MPLLTTEGQVLWNDRSVCGLQTHISQEVQMVNLFQAGLPNKNLAPQNLASEMWMLHVRCNSKMYEIAIRPKLLLQVVNIFKFQKERGELKKAEKVERGVQAIEALAFFSAVVPSLLEEKTGAEWGRM